jgi:hypothetical protein
LAQSGAPSKTDLPSQLPVKSRRARLADELESLLDRFLGPARFGTGGIEQLVIAQPRSQIRIPSRPAENRVHPGRIAPNPGIDLRIDHDGRGALSPASQGPQELRRTQEAARIMLRMDENIEGDSANRQRLRAIEKRENGLLGILVRDETDQILRIFCRGRRTGGSGSSGLRSW